MAKRKTTARPNIPQQTLARARQEAGLNPAEPQQKEEPGAPKAKAAPKKASSKAQVKHVATMEDLVTEYAYVVTDLRNMAILAAALFAALVIIALLI